ncbi:MAG: GTPase [Phycisphaerae bacterium]|nr:GTPase [Phycisphaerae bacterium]
MHPFQLRDTIVAIASGAAAVPRGIVRLSGGAAGQVFEQAFPTCALPPTERAAARRLSMRLSVFGCETPADLLCFAGPRSYTGEDVIEIHVPGSRPLLQEISRLLIVAGARPAGPGEFSARALRNGRMSLDQVGGVLALIHAGDAERARVAARLVRGEYSARLDAARDELLELLARVEAGIDFVDEEGVSFVSPAELMAGLRSPLSLLGELATGPRQARERETPHVGVFGLPNAGKSTLVNALLGRARVIESPIAGATRDVIASPHAIAGLPLMLQDTPGLGSASDALDVAAYESSRMAASEADVVVWVHAADVAWTPEERGQCEEVVAGRRAVLCISKCDTTGGDGSAQAHHSLFASVVETSAARGIGLVELEAAIGAALRQRDDESGGSSLLHGMADRARAGLRRIERLLAGDEAGFASADDAQVSPPWELIAMELREAIGAIESRGHYAVNDDMLGRIFARFCVGK